MVLKYMNEIKNRLLLSIFNWLFTVLCSYYNKDVLIYILTRPKLDYLVVTDLTEVFSAIMKLSIFTGNIFGSMFIFQQFCAFLLPALYPFEAAFLANLKGVLTTLITILVPIFCYYVVPMCQAIFIYMGDYLTKNTLKVYFEIKLTEYVEFVEALFCGFVLVTLTFCFILMYLSYLEKTTLSSLVTTSRKKAYASFVILATVITPPDVFSQIVVSLSLAVLLELFVFFVFVVNRVKKSVRQPIKANKYTC